MQSSGTDAERARMRKPGAAHGSGFVVSGILIANKLGK